MSEKEKNQKVETDEIENKKKSDELQDEAWFTSDGIVGKSRDEVIEKVKNQNK